MASISYNHSTNISNEKNWSNVVSVRLRVYKGQDLPPYTKTVKVPKGMTGMRKIKAFAETEAEAFETYCKNYGSASPGQRIPQKETFAEFAKHALLDRKSEKDMKPSTTIRYTELLRRINSEIGNMPLDEIQYADIKEFMRNMTNRADDPAVEESLKHLRNQQNGELLSRKTIREHLLLISSIFNEAIYEGKVSVNPAARIKFAVATPSPICFQAGELETILEFINSESVKWKAITYFLLGTGCRRGELAGLKKTAIDWTEGTVKVSSTLLVDKSVGVYETTPKSESSCRTLILPKQVLAIMKKYAEEQESRRKALGDKWVNSPYFFTQENGDRMHPDSITDFYKKFSKAHPELPHINPHKFRHTYASFLVAENTDIATVAKLMGHHDASVTLKIYTTALDVSVEEASKQVNEKFDKLIKDSEGENTEDASKQVSAKIGAPIEECEGENAVDAPKRVNKKIDILIGKHEGENTTSNP